MKQNQTEPPSGVPLAPCYDSDIVAAAVEWIEWHSNDMRGKFADPPQDARMKIRPHKYGDHESLVSASARILASAVKNHNVNVDATADGKPN